MKKIENPAANRAFNGNHDKPYNNASFVEINAAALSAGMPTIWFPQAKRYGHNLRAGNLFGDKGSSLWICLQTGAWKDHATGESGGDLISLYAAIKRIGQGEALRELSATMLHTIDRKAPVAAKKRIEPDDTAKISFALEVWRQGQAVTGTPVAGYLKSRNLAYKPDMPLKYHPDCPKGQERYPAMLALITDAETGEPCGVHRTFIKADGAGKADCKPNKMMLGRAANGVIRLTPSDEMGSGLGIVEGIENGLAILGIGWRPVWAALSSGGITNFPVLRGIEALTIFADNDKVGLESAYHCARRWTQAGREVTIRTPSKQGADWNDAVLEVMP